MRRLLPLLTCATLVLAGCGRRERSNPFDPLNPVTSGRPPGFTAVAGDREVRLRWQAVQGTSLQGYRVFRRGPGETDFQPITDVLDLLTSTIRDFPLANQQDYAYRLYFVFPSGLGTRPAEDVATPGAAIPWLVESRGTDLIRVAPDDRRVVSRLGGFVATSDLTVNPASGAVWITDEGSGRVVIYQPSSGRTVSVPGLKRPRAVAVDPFDGTGWVCDLGQDLVFHYQASGDEASFPIAPVFQPVDVAVDAGDGSVWVCELGAQRVSRYDATQVRWRSPVPDPSRVAIDADTGEGWVTSFTSGTVTRISSSGVPSPIPIAFAAPLGVAVDAGRGRIWIADPHAGAVIALRRDGTEEFRVTGLPDAGELSVDLGTGEAWAVLGATGELARISPAGTLVRRLGGLRSPFAVSIDPGGR